MTRPRRVRPGPVETLFRAVSSAHLGAPEHLYMHQAPPRRWLLQMAGDSVDPYEVEDPRQPEDRPMTMAQGLRSLITSGPGTLVVLGSILLGVSILIVVAQGALGNLWSTVIEIVVIIAGATAIRFLARRQHGPPT